MNLIRCEEKLVFFNNETFFNFALLKLFWFDCQIHYFVRDYDGFQLNSGLFFVSRLRIEPICALQEETIKSVSK